MTEEIMKKIPKAKLFDVFRSDVSSLSLTIFCDSLLSSVVGNDVSYIFSVRSGYLTSFKKSSSYDGVGDTSDTLVSLKMVLGDEVGHRKRGEIIDG